MRPWIVVSVFGAVACTGASTPNDREAPKAGLSPFVRAHVDRVQPASVAQFGAARAEWLRYLATHKEADPWWGTFFEVSGLGFMSLRPLSGLGDLGRPRPDEPKSPERRAAVDRYNQQSDDVLVFPHMSQIWSLEPDLGYQPAASTIRLDGEGWGHIIFEGVEPTRSDDYEKAWKAIHHALAEAHYPCARFTFSNVYGDGRIVSIWFGPSQQEVAVETALEHAIGPEKATELLRAARSAVVSTEAYAIRGRPDLSDSRF